MVLLDDLKSYVVLDKRGKLKFPPTIPKKRNKLQHYFTIGCFMLLCLLSTLHFNDYNVKCLEAACYGVLLLFVAEIIYMCILSTEEFLHHFEQRYGGSITCLLGYTFVFTWRSLTVLILSIVILYFTKGNGWIELKEMHIISFPLLAVFILLLKKVIKIEEAPIYKSLLFEEDDALNYSSAMAHSFYHGYLKLILPQTGGEDKNLSEIIEVYAGRHNVSVFPKLFILVPKSAVCPVSLEGPNIEGSSSLEEKQLTIAGVKQRVYKNSVYKILDPKEKPQKRYYVCAEYATPLRTFYKALETSGKYNELFKKHKDDIVLHFYLIMRELIENDPAIRDYCELIYYDDCDEKGRYIDVSHILLKKVKKKNVKKTE